MSPGCSAPCGLCLVLASFVLSGYLHDSGVAGATDGAVGVKDGVWLAFDTSEKEDKGDEQTNNNTTRTCPACNQRCCWTVREHTRRRACVG